MLSRPRALLFDLDGTLVDSHAGIAASIRHMLAAHGFGEPTREAFEGALSFPLRGMVARVTGAKDADRIEVLAQTYLDHYVATMVETSVPFPGIVEMLDALAVLGIPLAIVTNKTEVNARRIVEGRFGSRFATVVGAETGRPAKPDPTSAKLAAERLGVAPEACWLVGDSELDLGAAHAAGMGAIGVTWGIGDALAAKLTTAHCILREPRELVTAVGRALDVDRGVDGALERPRDSSVTDA